MLGIAAGRLTLVAARRPAGAPIDDAAARAIVPARSSATSPPAMRASRAFVDANFSLSGALRLHRQALGRDLLRAPANVALLAPYLALQLGGGRIEAPGRPARGALAGRASDCSSRPTSRAS